MNENKNFNAKNEKDVDELLSRIAELEKENYELKRLNSEAALKLKLYLEVEKATSSLFYTGSLKTGGITAITNENYFFEQLGYKFEHSPELNEKNFLSVTHPDDKDLFENKQKFFRDGNNNCLTSIYRVKHFEKTYKWFYSKFCLFPSDGSAIADCFAGIITEFSNNLVSVKQIEQLYKEFSLKKLEKLKHQLTLKEKKIGRMIISGLKAKDIIKKMKMSLSKFNGIKHDIYLKTGTSNPATLAEYFCSHGLV